VRLLAKAMLAAALTAALGAPAEAQARTPHIKHFFVIVLENENASSTFGKDSEAPYLAHRLRRQGAFLRNYYAIGHNSLDNYIAMVSGQAPNPQTQADCPFFTSFLPGTPTSDGQYIGSGCVYPPGVATVANLLEDSGYTWKGYMQDMATPCQHPKINSRDNTQTATKESQYAARHNPFVYFHAIIDFSTCGEHDVNLRVLRSDLRRRRTTPNFSFITPDLCNDGHDSPCVTGSPGGLEQANRFLRRWVPRIRRSPGFKDHGLLMITFDEAEAGPGDDADSSACCGEQPGPNTPSPGGQTPGPGGGRVGAVLLSPCIRRHTVVKEPFNHYSFLHTVEENFRLLPYLGYARSPGARSFLPAALTNPCCR